MTPDRAYELLVSAFWYCYHFHGQYLKDPAMCLLENGRMLLVSENPRLSDSDAHDIFCAKWYYIAELRRKAASHES